MITIGFIQETAFMAKSLNTTINLIMKSARMKDQLFISIKSDNLHISYGGNYIWRESIGIPSSNFGVESVSDIAKIIYLIDNDNETWRSFVYLENDEKILKK